MKVAAVTFVRDGEVSAIVNKTYVEEVRGFSDIQWTSTHVVFNMNDETIIAFKADRVHELVTYNEE
jgi:hypothetical protein